MSMSWMYKLRLRVLGFLVGVGLAAFALIALASAPVWPVVGFAVAAAALVINKAASRLTHPTCFSCGSDLTGRPASAYGIACDHCGALNHPVGLAARAVNSAPTTPPDSRA